MNCGSGESLNASVRCGFSPNARQMRLTAVWLIPVAAAIDRVDQWVAFAGLLLERLHDPDDEHVAPGAAMTSALIEPSVLGRLPMTIRSAPNSSAATTSCSAASPNR